MNARSMLPRLFDVLRVGREAKTPEQHTADAEMLARRAMFALGEVGRAIAEKQVGADVDIPAIAAEVAEAKRKHAEIASQLKALADVPRIAAEPATRRITRP
jgi:hypothetical protein